MLLWFNAVLVLALGNQEARDKLKAVGEELTQEQFDIERLVREEGSLLAAIEQAAQDAEAAENTLRESQRRRAKAVATLAEARAKEAAVQAEADSHLRVLEPRLRAWQRLSPGRRVELLLSANGAQEAERRERALHLILGRDLAEVRGTLVELKTAKQERAEVAALESELLQRSAEAQAAELEAQARRAHHAALLAAVREERGLHQRAAKELKGAQDHLTQVVAALPAEKMESTHFLDAQGHLSWPVEGELEIGFGPILNPRFNTITLQKGDDFRATAGTPVRSVHRGRIVLAGFVPGYGNLAIVDHGDAYFSLFAHLATIKPSVDDVVSAGDEIGTVGESGSLKGPYLYFEIRHHAEALDPALWLAPQAPAQTQAAQ